jgi:polyhydroxybutyrate depolymerase
MKKLTLILLFIVTATTGIFAQRPRGPLAEKIRAARQNKTGNKNNSQPAPANNGSYIVGKNRLTTVVNGDTREYYVSVPRSYDKSKAVPVVFMLHGTSGDGLKYYNISGWKEVGETENIITVYPSSWHHCIIEDGVRKNTTKWNIYPGSFEYCPGEVPKDDIKFLSQVIDELCSKFNVNQKMIYFVGFSNGGQMTARIGVEMSDRVAAVVSSAGMLQPGTSYTPKRLLPNLFQFGSNDDRFMPAFGGQPAPMDINQLMTVPFMKGAMGTYQKTYQLESKYTTGGDPNKLIWLDAKGTSGNPNNVFRFALIKGMTHQYPNGKNFPLNGAQMNWQWLKQFKLP